MINRRAYIEMIQPFVDKPFIKVINGLRRSGKSTLLLLLIKRLEEMGIASKHIIFLNFESFGFSEINNASVLYSYIKEKISGKGKYYLFFDEIQEVPEWEKAINSFMVDFNVDIYITGSNSRLLSSELSTYLAGRYVEFHIQTLSFSEYCGFPAARLLGTNDPYVLFEDYRRKGGFPAIHLAPYPLESALKIAFDIYSSAILRDTVQRFQIRNIELLERVVRFVLNNVGNSFSAKSVADYFKAQQRKLDTNTIYNYLNALESSYIIYRVPRFDVKGKEILKTQEKYFTGDISFLYALMGLKDRFISGVLENIVMLEFIRRGFKVFVGKLDQLEIDFVGEKEGAKIYVQVAYLLPEKKTVDREFSPLLAVKDNFPKYVITMDEKWKDNVEGVIHMHIADFLLADW
jgi:predicted AAA+ superfamily ATPase